MGRPHGHSRTNVHLLNYHLVWCPKRRRRWLTGEVRAALCDLLASIAGERGGDLIALEVMPDHVHCFIGAPPRESIAQIVRRLKGSSSRELRKRFRRLRSLPVVWSPSYFAGSAGNVSSDTIERYIADQRTR